MNVMELSDRIKKLNLILNAKMDELKRLESICEGTAINMTGEKVQSTPDPQRVENVYLTMIVLKSDIVTIQNDIVIMKSQLLDVINTLDDSLEIDILVRKLVDGSSITKISHDLHYSRQHVHRTYKRALNKIMLQNVTL